MQPGRPPRNHQPNHSSVHLLWSQKVISELVDNAVLGPDDLVMDLGAGTGSITAELVRTRARVLAVERDEEFVGDLERRYGDHENLRVVHDDLLSVPLPHREFAVVANIPFSITTALLRRLLNTPNGSLTQADLLVEWGMAKRLTAAWPRDLEAAWWAARFEISIKHRVPATAFRPAPKIDAAHLVFKRKTGQSKHLQGVIWALLSTAYGGPNVPARTALTSFITRGRAHRMLHEIGIESQAPVGTIKLSQWLGIATELAADKSLSWPPLPKNLRTDGSRREEAPNRGLRAPQGKAAQGRANQGNAGRGQGNTGQGKAAYGKGKGGHGNSGQDRSNQGRSAQGRSTGKPRRAPGR